MWTSWRPPSSTSCAIRPRRGVWAHRDGGGLRPWSDHGSQPSCGSSAACRGKYPMATVRSKAPLRISFSGGGTDVPPYPQDRGGVALSTTIDKYAYCSLAPNTDGEIRVTSLDYD